MNKRNTKHGFASTVNRFPEYYVWKQMIRRCTAKSADSYERYGGRGIAVCKRWMKFSNFLDDMGRRPSDQHSIERKNNNKNYDPANCVWGTIRSQNSNKRSTIILTAFGKSQPLAFWSEESGIARCTIYQRVRHGWPHAKAVSLKTTRTKPKRKKPCPTNS